MHPLLTDCTCNPSPGYFPQDVIESEVPSESFCALHSYLESVEADMDQEENNAD